MTGGSNTVPERVSIFVTVGTELPFNRLVRAVDEWAGLTGRGDQVFAQTGHSEFAPRHIRSSTMLDGRDFRRLFSEADLVIAHAGMGTIISALEAGQPLVVVPRRADLGEHRNDHQRATVDRLVERGLVTAVDETELGALLGSPPYSRFARSLPTRPGNDLVSAVRRFIRDIG